MGQAQGGGPASCGAAAVGLYHKHDAYVDSAHALRLKSGRPDVLANGAEYPNPNGGPDAIIIPSSVQGESDQWMLEQPDFANF
jgi:hypothetical protein